MANITSNPEDMLQCPICLEQYEIPRALPCLHTFCEKCLVDWVKHKSVMNTLTIGSQRCFPCPVCKDDVSVPPEGIKGFRHNFYVANVIEPTSPAKKTPSGNNSLEEVDKNVACHRCEEKGVSKICLKCNTWLCPLCCDDHKRVKDTKGHILASNTELTDVLINDEITDNQLSVCHDHTKSNSNYCLLCKSLLCDDCQKVKHESHTVISVTSKVDEVRSKLIDCMTRLQKRREALQRQQASLKSAKDELLSHGQKTIIDFDRSYYAVQKKIDSMRKNLPKKIHRSLAAQMTKLDERITSISDKLTIEESVEEDIKSVIGSNNKKDILTQADMLSEQGEHCLSTHLINLDNITITVPSWRECEKDLFDQLITKLLGSCTFSCMEVNLNKRIKKKAKRSCSSSSKRNKSNNKEVDKSVDFAQLESRDNNSNPLCDIIRDFDPFGPADDVGNDAAGNAQQQQTDEAAQSNDVSEECIEYPTTVTNNYDCYDELDDGPVDSESPPSDVDVDLAATVGIDDNTPPPTGPFYDDEIAPETGVPYWWPPPHPLSDYHPPPLPPLQVWGGSGGRGVRHHSPPPRFLHGAHHHHQPPPPPPFFGSPSHRGTHHRGRGHRHRAGRHHCAK